MNCCSFFHWRARFPEIHSCTCITKMNVCFDNHTRRVRLPPETVALFESLKMFSELKMNTTPDTSSGSTLVDRNEAADGCGSEAHNCAGNIADTETSHDTSVRPIVSKSCHGTSCDDSYCCINANYDCFVNLVDLYNYCSENKHLTEQSLVRTEQFVEWFSAVTQTHGRFADMFVLHTYLQGCKACDHVFTFCFEQMLMRDNDALSNEHRTVNARHILGIEN